MTSSAEGSEMGPPPVGESPVEASARSITQIEAVGFFPADYGVVESGKVYASGAYWTRLNFPAFPAVLPMCSLVAVLSVPWAGHNHDHEFHMRLENGDGQLLEFDIGGQFRGAPAPEMDYGESGDCLIAVHVPGLTFQSPGAYAFLLEVDGARIARYPFRVSQRVPGLPFALPRNS